jgi:hypothetical protein
MQTMTSEADFERHLTKKYGTGSYALKIFREQVQTVAKEIRASDKANQEGFKHLLQTARRLSEGLGYGSLQGLQMRLCKGGLDADSFRGLDDVAERMATNFPEYFAGAQDNQQRLFELLSQGNPVALSRADALQQAAECVGGQHVLNLDSLGKRWQAGEKITLLAQEVGYSWNRLWCELTDLGYSKGGGRP